MQVIRQLFCPTDTEIDQNYYEMMKNSVGDEFTLVYSEKTKSTSIKKGYFQEFDNQTSTLVSTSKRSAFSFEGKDWY